MKIFRHLITQEGWDLDAKLSITGSLVLPDVAGNILAHGWPETFKPEVVNHILSYLVDAEEIA